MNYLWKDVTRILKVLVTEKRGQAIVLMEAEQIWWCGSRCHRSAAVPPIDAGCGSRAISNDIYHHLRHTANALLQGSLPYLHSRFGSHMVTFVGFQIRGS